MVIGSRDVSYNPTAKPDALSTTPADAWTYGHGLLVALYFGFPIL